MVRPVLQDFIRKFTITLFLYSKPNFPFWQLRSNLESLCAVWQFRRALFAYVIGLHAVQFENTVIGWEKFWGQPKLDEAIGRVQFGSPRNFFNPIISKLDKPVAYELYSIQRTSSSSCSGISSSFLTSLRSARHRSNTLTHFFVLFWVFLFWLFALISSKSIASISGNLAEESIWNSESSKRWREKSGNSAIINTKQNPASDDRSLTFESSDNSCNLIGQIFGSFIYLDIWSVDGKYPDFPQIGQFVQSWRKRSGKNYPIYFKFGQLAKINKK